MATIVSTNEKQDRDLLALQLLHDAPTLSVRSLRALCHVADTHHAEVMRRGLYKDTTAFFDDFKHEGIDGVKMKVRHEIPSILRTLILPVKVKEWLECYLSQPALADEIANEVKKNGCLTGRLFYDGRVSSTGKPDLLATVKVSGVSAIAMAELTVLLLCGVAETTGMLARAWLRPRH